MGQREWWKKPISKGADVDQGKAVVRVSHQQVDTAKDLNGVLVKSGA